MRSLLVMIVMVIFTACSNKEQVVVSPSDYEQFLTETVSDKESKLRETVDFWNTKIKSDSIQLTALSSAAQVYSQIFKHTNNIKYLKNAEKCLLKAFDVSAIKKESFAMALAQNYITQHRFKEAKKVLLPYETMTSVNALQYILFDINMELGNYVEAEMNLNNFKNPSDFNYLIRVAKYSDYKGNLAATIRYMEKALKKAESANNQSLLVWAYTNLGDYYGHDGRIKDSYDSYVKTLEIAPDNVYAKKGVAWILYSYEKKPAEALALLESATNGRRAPDHYLLMGEIAKSLHDDEQSKKYMTAYENLIANTDYGVMYDHHNAFVLIDDYNNPKIGKELAEKEVINRPTPGSYALLAYATLKAGDEEKALEIVNEFVVDKTYEPAAQLIAAKIYKANYLNEKASTLKKELIDATFELGPSYEKEIQKL
ncbi:tetratricopeptide repeat protein [Spongiivirga citrea]|uniref:Uncharacterized protein n=1 Tax=Spongiivirga citrea TaxID=1481457 RepID=A0A6M0CCY0_9FLAO|nr:hypothetical protein [Spongiivirga citrea]NER15688.1 hypothetical protein [Spongiivirga citrea]